MYLGETHEGEAARDHLRGPFVPDFAGAVIEAVEKVELWHSSIDDQGDDFNEWRVFDEEGRLISKRRQSGY